MSLEAKLDAIVLAACPCPEPCVDDTVVKTPEFDGLKINLNSIIDLIQELVKLYGTQELVLKQFELLWAKVEATDWPSIKNPTIEKLAKKALHAVIVAAIKHYVPA